ncbi:MAG: hypothetical protein H0W74_03680 [Sphingosinicella sp.]|nr:hypothetical protein [Sphingosinicella sp.]
MEIITLNAQANTSKISQIDGAIKQPGCDPGKRSRIHHPGLDFSPATTAGVRAHDGST